MQMDIESRAKLNNGVEIPWVGLGVYRSPAGKVTENGVLTAFKIGYRHIDTAAIYRNEASVGKAVKECGLPREEIFITTKLWNSNHGYEQTIKACNNSLEKLGLDYIDLYLIHWPVEGLRLKSWKAMEFLLEEGEVRAIGISNYMPSHLNELLDNCNIKPVVNQIELSPYNFLYRTDIVELCQTNDIILEAYSPLTKARKLQDPKLMDIADKYSKTPAQVLIRYILQKNCVVLPKSINPSRIRENAEVFDFVISQEDIGQLDSFNENLITGWDPTNAP